MRDQSTSKEPAVATSGWFGLAPRDAMLVFGILAGWTLLFAPTWVEWVRFALGHDLHSHVLLIPAVTVYLLHADRASLGPVRVAGSRRWIPWALVALVGWGVLLGTSQATGGVDQVALHVALWLLGLWSLLFGLLGGAWWRSACFPLLFLLFMIPIPAAVEHGLQNLLMTASAWLTEWVFDLGGIPVHRRGQILEIPGIVMEVAEECSGIRSTWVLLITSILASYMFLRSPLRRLILVAFVLPLGVLRNAIRIYVIGWLCVEKGPHMIDSWIHREGGPVFFAISLVPLLVLAWLLRRGEGKSDDKRAAIPLPGEARRSGSSTQ